MSQSMIESVTDATFFVSSIRALHSLNCLFQWVMVSQLIAKCPPGLIGVRAVRHAALERERVHAMSSVTLAKAVNRVQYFERSNCVAACAAAIGSTSVDPTSHCKPCHKAKTQCQQPTKDKKLFI